MSHWTKLAPLAGRNNPCMNCPPILAEADPEKIIAVGFGDACVTRDGEEVECWSVRGFVPQRRTPRDL
jgi:hypothetical protein